MNIFKIIVVVTLLCYPSVYIYSQINISDINTSNVFSSITAKTKYGKLKSQKNKGKISGMGIFQYRNGDIYYGDLYDKEFHGTGTLISNDSITNCPNSAIYVGKFKNGIKTGKGHCFNKDGELIYWGNFINDKPTDPYPTTDFTDTDFRFFTSLDGEGYTFIGEFIGDNPNGHGLIIYDTGDVYISKFHEGTPTGISVYIKSDGEWFSEKNSDGISTQISSSQEYSLLKRQASDNFNHSMSIVMGYLSQAIESAGQLSSQIQSISNSGTVSTFNNNEGIYIDKPTSSHSSGSTTSEKYNISEQQSYNRDKSTYHKYDGMLSKAFAGNSSASASEIKEWQRKMKQLREKWEKKGRDFPHFANEDK